MLVALVLSSDVNDFTVKRNVALPSQRILAAIPFVALKRQSRCRRSNVALQSQQTHGVLLLVAFRRQILYM